jgi:hypothetical protein
MRLEQHLFMGLRRVADLVKSTVGTFWIRREQNKSWSLNIGVGDELEVLNYYLYVNDLGYARLRFAQRINGPHAGHFPR